MLAEARIAKEQLAQLSRRTFVSPERESLPTRLMISHGKEEKWRRRKCGYLLFSLSPFICFVLPLLAFRFQATQGTASFPAPSVRRSVSRESVFTTDDSTNTESEVPPGTIENSPRFQPWVARANIAEPRRGERNCRAKQTLAPASANERLN